MDGRCWRRIGRSRFNCAGRQVRGSRERVYLPCLRILGPYLTQCNARPTITPHPTSRNHGTDSSKEIEYDRAHTTAISRCYWGNTCGGIGYEPGPRAIGRTSGYDRTTLNTGGGPRTYYDPTTLKTGGCPRIYCFRARRALVKSLLPAARRTLAQAYASTESNPWKRRHGGG
jgi:hypothetical protein